MLRTVILFLVFLISLTQSTLWAGEGSARKLVSLEKSHLPLIVLTSIDSITIDDKVMGLMEVYWSSDADTNSVFDLPHYDGWVGIEYRGSSSAFFPKPQFNIETRWADSSNRNFPLLDLPAENDWILHGPFSDKSLLRNVLAYYMYGQMGHYSARTRFCEVVLDGDYQGLYMLTEKIKVDDGRVDLAELEPEDVDGDQVTGGYVFKLDKRSGSQQVGWYSLYPGLNGSGNIPWYQFHHPKPSNLNNPQREYLISYMNQLERKLLAYPPPNSQQLRQLIDFDTFIDHLLLYEFSRNVDGYRLSTFFYKDKDSKDERLFMGPVWDFNLAFGNADYYDGSYYDGWQMDFPVLMDNFQLPLWWRTLTSDAGFREQMVDRWAALREGPFQLDSLHAQIDAWVEEIGGAQLRNFELWEILDLYVWPNAFVGNTYEAEIQYLKDWLTGRVEFMDAELERIGSENAGLPMFASLSANPARSVSYLSLGIEKPAEVSIDLFGLNGQLARNFVSGQQIDFGNYTFQLDLNGLAPGVYLLRSSIGSEQVVQKLVIF